VTGTKEIMTMTKHFLALAAALPLAACASDNMGLDSVHQPIVSATKAEVKDCPDWSSQWKDSAAPTSSNYGCAVNSNLAAMIADPADLLRGRTAPPSTEVGVRAIKSWREMQPTGKQQQATTASVPGGK
jgi:type IV pilus biogenesis protein CpaD/CtpE